MGRDLDLVDVAQVQILVGGAPLSEDVVSFEVRSIADAPLDWAVIEIDNADGEAAAPVEGADIELAAGYVGDESLPVVFGGRVETVERDRLIRVVCADACWRLRDTRIRRSWAAVTPAELAVDVFALSGVSVGRVSADVLPRRPAFVSPNITALEVLEWASRAWGLTNWQLYADTDGSIWWGPWQQSPRQASSELLTFDLSDVFDATAPDGEFPGRIVARLTGTLRHGQMFLLLDSRHGAPPVYGRAAEVVHAMGPHPQLPVYRTEVTWAPLV